MKDGSLYPTAVLCPDPPGAIPPLGTVKVVPENVGYRYGTKVMYVLYSLVHWLIIAISSNKFRFCLLVIHVEQPDFSMAKAQNPKKTHPNIKLTSPKQISERTKPMNHKKSIVIGTNDGCLSLFLTLAFVSFGIYWNNHKCNEMILGTACMNPPSAPEFTFLKSVWDGKPIPFGQKARYQCKDIEFWEYGELVKVNHRYFVSNQSITTIDVECLPGGNFKTPSVWPTCTDSEYH